MKPVLNRWIGLGCLLLAGYFLVQVGQGLMTGEITALSKYSQTLIRRTAQPERFWLAIGFWSLGAGILLVTGVKKITHRN